MVTNGYAYFDYVDPSGLNLLDDETQPEPDEHFDQNTFGCWQANESVSMNEEFDHDIEDGCSEGEVVDDAMISTTQMAKSDGDFIIGDGEEITAFSNAEDFIDDGETAAVGGVSSGDKDQCGFSKFCMRNKVVEGMLCGVVEPTILTLVIEKISGFNVTLMKDKMHTMMFKKCSHLPALENIIPGKNLKFLRF